jgi:hypothetical protein
MEKVKRYRFAVGGVIMVLAMGLLAVLLGVPGTRRPVPTFEELAGPEPTRTRLPSREEILEGLPTMEELIGSQPKHYSGRQSRRAWVHPQVFQWECPPRRPSHDYLENPLEDYFAKQRMRKQQREAEWDQTEMMNTMRSIESDLDQIRLQQQQDHNGSNKNGSASGSEASRAIRLRIEPPAP